MENRRNQTMKSIRSAIAQRTSACGLISIVSFEKPEQALKHSFGSNPAELDKSLFAGIIYAKRVDNSATVTNKKKAM